MGYGVVVVVVTVVVTVVVVFTHKLAPRSSKARKREAGPRGWMAVGKNNPKLFLPVSPLAC